MIELINEILATKAVSVSRLHTLIRVGDSDVFEIEFEDITLGRKYYAKVNVQLETILIFHKNIRLKSRENRNPIKNSFWDKWKPTNFCVIDTDGHLKTQMQKDLDQVVRNDKFTFDDIDWGPTDRRQIFDREI